MRSFSIPKGVVAVVRPNRADSLDTWVSTTTPTLMPKAFPKTTFAVFEPPRARQPALQVLGEHHLDGPASVVARPVQELGFVPVQSNGLDVLPNGFG